jgi:ERO1-like protein alpha
MTRDPAPAVNGTATGVGGGMKRRGGRWWYAAAGALIVALLVVVVSYYSFRGIPFSPPGGCGCLVRESLPLVFVICFAGFGEGPRGVHLVVQF